MPPRCVLASSRVWQIDGFSVEASLHNPWSVMAVDTVLYRSSFGSIVNSLSCLLSFISLFLSLSLTLSPCFLNYFCFEIAASSSHYVSFIEIRHFINLLIGMHTYVYM
jgi:hypothetical protein